MGQKAAQFQPAGDLRAEAHSWAVQKPSRWDMRILLWFKVVQYILNLA